MSYVEMSDDKINLSVFECLFGKIGDDRDMLRVWQQGKFQPCNSWTDAGPIILENRIGLTPSVDIWHAYSDEEDFLCSIANPLRAAMIVFLMMQESK